jgi:uncharacterized protein
MESEPSSFAGRSDVVTLPLPETLEANIARFAAGLRSECGFNVGPGEEIDALHALKTIGLESRELVRLMLRPIFCARYDEMAVFDRIFERFFTQGPEGVSQPLYAPRHTLPRPPREHPRRETPLRSLRPAPQPGSATDGPTAPHVPRSISGDGTERPREHELVGSRASAAVPAPQAPALVIRDPRALLTSADTLLRALHFGRTRRWHSAARGPRFDLRSTLRASLRTAGEPFLVRRLGHPHRNPRVVVAIDASRSMEGQREEMLHFAWALAQRSQRTAVFIFSTGLREISGALREPLTHGVLRLPDIAEAWGGGTRIGAALKSMIRRYGHRVLSRDSLLVIFSDGLDVGEPELLRSAMRELRRKTAGVVWVNPLLASPDYEPSARGMRAAIPFVTSFLPGGQAQTMGELIASQRTHLAG